MTYVNRDEPDLDAVQRGTYESLLLAWTTRRGRRRLPLPIQARPEQRYAARTLRSFRRHYDACRSEGTPLEMSLGATEIARSDVMMANPLTLEQIHGVYAATWTAQGLCKGFHAAVRQADDADHGTGHWSQTRSLLRHNRAWLESAFVVLERSTQPTWTQTASGFFEKALDPAIDDLGDFLLMHHLHNPSQHFGHDEAQDLARYQAWHEVLGILVALDIFAYQDRRLNQKRPRSPRITRAAAWTASGKPPEA